MVTKPKVDASTYSTGGGGVSFERTYGATLLTSLLLGDTAPGLGDELVLVEIAFQAGNKAPVDDFVLRGVPRVEGNGRTRYLAVGVRRDPVIAKSDAKFVKLLTDFLSTKSKHEAAIAIDGWRLALVVSGPHTGAAQMAELAELARTQATSEDFRKAVSRKAAPIRTRMTYLDEAVALAVAQAGPPPDEPEQVVWGLLRATWAIQVHLEGESAPDRANAIARLAAISRDPPAHELFGRLTDLAGRLAVSGAVVDEATVRRALVGDVSLGRSGRCSEGWALLGRLEQQLRARTSDRLVETKDPSATPLSLPRTLVLQRVAARMRAASQSVSCVLISGEPDVGKSSVAISSADILRLEDASVVLLSLRDLPSSTVAVEGCFHVPLVEVLSGGEVAAHRIVVLDGAEVALEGGLELLRYVVTAALRSGFAVVAVSRADAFDAVNELVGSISESLGRPGPVRETVEGLSDAEVRGIATAFSFLEPLAAEPRARWLLSRPGLVQMLLKADAYRALPGGALSEADVFAAMWKRVVRNNEVRDPGGPSPDARESALVALARKELDPKSIVEPDATALPSLRSDGLLEPLDSNSAWRSGDHFANDLVRDFAVARLLLTSDMQQLLVDARAPRWALRAVRVACQAAMVQSADTEKTRISLDASFKNIATDFGERWIDVPWEALLTLGQSAPALGSAAGALFEPTGQTLARVVRLVRQRFGSASTVEPLVAGPLIAQLCEHASTLPNPPSGSEQDLELLIEEWLAGLAIRGASDASDSLRIRVRDEFLERTIGYHNDHLVRCLGRLGPDLDGPCIDILRDLAVHRPRDLAACVEDVAGAMTLARQNPDLLVELARAFYIEHPDPRDRRRFGFAEEGIRGHSVGGGLMSPMVAWHYGPFFALLQRAPRQGIAFINEMLNHAAAHRVDSWAPRPTTAPAEQLPGLHLDVAGLGPRRYVGDADVWCWYRGSSTGPYPCMSALLALERFADGLLGMKMPPGATAQMVLAGSNNMATLALALGVLVRDIDRVADDLDAWLVHPAIWRLEFGRAMHEHGGFRVQGPDPKERVNAQRSTWSLREVSYYLVAQSYLRHDRKRLATLTRLGEELLRVAGTEIDRQEPSADGGDEGGSDKARHEHAANEARLAARGWASTLMVENYRRVVDSEGQAAIQYEAPKAVTAGLAESHAEHDRVRAGLRLVMEYASRTASPTEDQLRADIAVARELEVNSLSDETPAGPDAAPAAVAATALRVHATGELGVSASDLSWAVGCLDAVAKEANAGNTAVDVTVFPIAGDRSAARGLPFALAIRDQAWGADVYESIVAGIGRLAKSGASEVRRILSQNMAPLWAAPCLKFGAGTPCVHVATLDVIATAARHCRMGPWDETGRRPIDPLSAELSEALPGVATEDLLADRLVGPIATTSSCASSACCVADQAERLCRDMLEAHRRSRAYFAERNVHFDDDDDYEMAAVLLQPTRQDDLREHVKSYADEAVLLGTLLRDLCRVATSDANMRVDLVRVWPVLMEQLLRIIESGKDYSEDRYFGMRAVAALVPHPTTNAHEKDIDGVLREAANGWLGLSDLSGLIERWLLVARGDGHCLDALIGLLETQPLSQQVEPGLKWIASLAEHDFRAASSSWRLVEWLQSIHSELEGEQATALLQRLLDGLVAAGDSRALALQKSIE